MNEQESRSSNAPMTYTVYEIAELLKISRTPAYRLVNEGQFKIVRIGNVIRISRKSFDAWLEQQEN